MLPGQPPPQAPLVCLDTETTGLATAAGTVAFLIGLGWWEGDRFRQVQLLLPGPRPRAGPADGAGGDHRPERLAGHLQRPRASTGRCWWPASGLPAAPLPLHAGHLDLLPIVRRLFRHRMDDAQAADGRGATPRAAPDRRRRRLGDPRTLPAVPSERDRPTSWSTSSVTTTRTCDHSPDSSSTSKSTSAIRTGERRRRPATSPASPVRSPASIGWARRWPVSTTPRHEPSQSSASETRHRPGPRPGTARSRGGRRAPRRTSAAGRGESLEGLGPPRAAAFHVPWSQERITIDRAHLLRRLGRHAEAAEAWESLAAGDRPDGDRRQHRACQAPRAPDCATARRRVTRHPARPAIVERRRQLGRPEPVPRGRPASPAATPPPATGRRREPAIGGLATGPASRRRSSPAGCPRPCPGLRPPGDPARRAGPAARPPAMRRRPRRPGPLRRRIRRPRTIDGRRWPPASPPGRRRRPRSGRPPRRAVSPRTATTRSGPSRAGAQELPPRSPSVTRQVRASDRSSDAQLGRAGSSYEVVRGSPRRGPHAEGAAGCPGPASPDRASSGQVAQPALPTQDDMARSGTADAHASPISAGDRNERPGSRVAVQSAGSSTTGSGSTRRQRTLDPAAGCLDVAEHRALGQRHDVQFDAGLAKQVELVRPTQRLGRRP